MQDILIKFSSKIERYERIFERNLARYNKYYSNYKRKISPDDIPDDPDGKLYKSFFSEYKKREYYFLTFGYDRVEAQWDWDPVSSLVCNGFDTAFMFVNIAGIAGIVVFIVSGWEHTWRSFLLLLFPVWISVACVGMVFKNNFKTRIELKKAAKYKVVCEILKDRKSQ